MAAAAHPFIPEHAAEFARQLMGFLASKLTVAGHDRAVFGDLPSSSIQQSSRPAAAGTVLTAHAVYMLTIEPAVSQVPTTCCLTLGPA